MSIATGGGFLGHIPGLAGQLDLSAWVLVPHGAIVEARPVTVLPAPPGVLAVCVGAAPEGAADILTTALLNP
jgi:hypothetical protein